MKYKHDTKGEQKQLRSNTSQNGKQGKQNTKQANELSQIDGEFDFCKSVEVIIGGRLEHGAGLCCIAAMNGNGNGSKGMNLQLLGLCK
jgi:hypothetical protein